MENVKVLPKGQITIPVNIRKKLNIKVGDMIFLEDTQSGVFFRKGITLFDVAGKIRLKSKVSNKELIKMARQTLSEKNI
jgi:AbrB family looped-hinge helix DNA binding protein